mmetsp:Transcript_47238/g.84525  ORF Transcript_47238/g.84525 Transcript_47238/m.84525 type:complete len:216 (-) Transcript_47238:433-1080(-)
MTRGALLCFMMKGGFSLMSCPMLMIKSALLMAACTMSLSDKAVHPMYPRFLSLTTPFPICVQTAIKPVFCIRISRALAVFLRFAAAAMQMRGRLAAWINCTAWSITLGSTSGRRPLLIGVRVGQGKQNPSSGVTGRAAMSSAISMCTGPGFSSRAMRMALRTTGAMRSGSSTVLVNLVISLKWPITSTIWNAPCLLCRMGFWPVMHSIGNPPRKP